MLRHFKSLRDYAHELRRALLSDVVDLRWTETRLPASEQIDQGQARQQRKEFAALLFPELARHKRNTDYGRKFLSCA